MNGDSKSMDNSFLTRLKPSELTDFYDEFFCALFAELKLIRPVIIAHSIGAFLAMKSPKLFVTLKPSYLILVNPAGILPTLGSYGAYWAVLFWLGIPMSLFRVSTIITSFIYFGTVKPFWIGITRESLRQKYWIQLQATPTMVNIPAKFIKQNFTTSCWNMSAIGDVLAMRSLIRFIWSDQDDIVNIR